MAESEKTLEEIYEPYECGMCGESIEPGEWCGNEDCPLSPDSEANDGG